MSEWRITIGQLSKKIDVSIRTLRYYDKINLLKPLEYTEGGHRLYGAEEFLRLQQIQSLKFIGFSLTDILNLLNQQAVPNTDIKQMMHVKREELHMQLEEIQTTIEQLDHMEFIIDDSDYVDLKLFCFIIHAVIWENRVIRNPEVLNKINRSNRKKIDHEYYKLFVKMKKLISMNIAPDSIPAQDFAQKLVKLSQKTLQGTSEEEINEVKKTSLPSDYQLLDPFTPEERKYLIETMDYFNRKKEKEELP